MEVCPVCVPTDRHCAQSNRITTLKGLEALVNLEELYLSHNGLTRLNGLERNVRSLPELSVAF